LYRRDKLKAHILTSHNAETVFNCNDVHVLYTTEACDMSMTRAPMAIHVRGDQDELIFNSVTDLRSCPTLDAPSRLTPDGSSRWATGSYSSAQPEEPPKLLRPNQCARLRCCHEKFHLSHLSRRNADSRCNLDTRSSCTLQLRSPFLCCSVAMPMI
jgi:hypothetical protein